MMKKSILLFSLVGFLTSGFVFSQGNYADFETENMELYRVSYSFEYPEFPEKEGNTQPIVSDWNTNDADTPEKGEVEYKMEPGINRLMTMHLSDMDEDNMTDGFRVQLFAGSNLGTANKIKSDFKMAHDDDEVYLDWEQPTFRVRAGDFLTRSEAMIFCNELKTQFMGAFVVKDRVKKPELRKEKFDPDALDNELDQIENRLPEDNR